VLLREIPKARFPVVSKGGLPECRYGGHTLGVCLTMYKHWYTQLSFAIFSFFKSIFCALGAFVISSRKEGKHLGFASPVLICVVLTKRPVMKIK